MLRAAIIGHSRSGPGRFSMRRRIRHLRCRSLLRTLGFTRKPPGLGIVRTCFYLNYSKSLGVFELFLPRRRSEATYHAWFRTSALSQLDFRVDRDEFAAGVVDLHLPINAALGAVDVG